MDNKRRIIALVTVYYPENENVENINMISEQVDLIVVCDNSPNDNSHLFNSFKNLIYFFWNRNLGLSASFNKVLTNSSLLWCDSDYVIFFDQDSIIPKNHIASLVQDYESLEKKGFSVGCIGPIFFNDSMGEVEIPTLNEKVDNSILKVKGIITSSMLCRYESIKEISYWNEKIFLDMADWDLCWRFIDSKKFCFMTKNTIMNHCVGEGKKKILFFNLRIAKPFREYYQTRDCLYLLRKRYVPWNFRLRFILRILFRPLVHILFLDEPLKRAKFIFNGIKDFCQNKSGEVISD